MDVPRIDLLSGGRYKTLSLSGKQRPPLDSDSGSKVSVVIFISIAFGSPYFIRKGTIKSIEKGEKLYRINMRKICFSPPFLY